MQGKPSHPGSSGSQRGTTSRHTTWFRTFLTDTKSAWAEPSGSIIARTPLWKWRWGKPRGSISRGSKAYASPAMTAAPHAGTGCARPGAPFASAAILRTWERFMNELSGGWAAVCSAHATGCHSTTRAGIARRRRRVTSVASTGFFDWPAIRAAGKSIRRFAETVGWMTKAPEYWVFGSLPVSPNGSGLSKAMRLRHSAGRFPVDRGVSCRRPVT